MKMTKALTITWIPSTDCVDLSRRCSSERLLKLIEMELDGKTLPDYKSVFTKKNTKCRAWRDQAAVDEWIEFMYYLANKYNGKMTVDEITDI
jgi:hypothetical protein